MQTSYIYSTSRVNTLSHSLLTKTDIERLLVAKAGEDLQLALKETYLAPYILHAKDDSLAEAIEQSLIEAKELIHRIAPSGEMFETLWVQYDIHNLRVFAKAQTKDLSYEECEPYVSYRGTYEPETVFAHAQAGTLNRLQSDWQIAFEEAVRLATAGELDAVDGIFDAVLFTAVSRIANKTGDAFIRKYVKAIINMYNLKSRLRIVGNSQVNFTPTFISGGDFNAEEIDSKEQVFAAFANQGGADFWRDAIEYHQATQNTTRLDARSDEYILSLAKQAGFDMFSSASLVAYYLMCRQAAANIRTIVVGKNSGQKEEDIRANLRLAYVAE